jgi:uncharacterized protein YceK
MKKIIQSLIALLVVSILAGCASVQSSTSRFHKLPEIGNGESFAFLPTTDQKGGLEYESYCERIESKLIEYGWIPSKNIQTSDYLVFFTYSINGGETVSGSTPIYGQTGGGTSYTSGTVSSYGGSANYSGTTYTAPTFGQVGSVSYNTQVFGRNLDLTIIDEKESSKDNPVKLYEGRVTSHGSSADIAVVLPTMIESLFKDFPGKSGKTKKVAMPLVK